MNNLMWLSFCDDERPKGQQFLGVLIAPGKDVLSATQWAWENGLNPGGEVLGTSLGNRSEEFQEYVGRLIGKAEAKEIAARKQSTDA